MANAEIMRTDEKYDCPNSLRAVVVLFPSLQCDMSACGGVVYRGRPRDVCVSCEHYVENAQRKDWAEIDKPASGSGRR